MAWGENVRHCVYGEFASVLVVHVWVFSGLSKPEMSLKLSCPIVVSKIIFSSEYTGG